MPTYDYEIITTGQVIQVEQSIKEPAHTVLELDGELRCVRRLISGAPRFNLISGDSGGWSEAGYSKLPHERKAEAKLGRKLTKRAE
jgi:hypothetical protein